MGFNEVKDLNTLEQYIKSGRTKWKKDYVQVENDYEVDIVFYFYGTPLIFYCRNGNLYFLGEYTGKYFISNTTCHYLHHMKMAKIQFGEPLHSLDYETFYSVLINVQEYGGLLGMGLLKNPKAL